MKNTLKLALVAFAVSFTAVACNESTETPAETPTEDTAAAVATPVDSMAATTDSAATTVDSTKK